MTTTSVTLHLFWLLINICTYMGARENLARIRKNKVSGAADSFYYQKMIGKQHEIMRGLVVFNICVLVFTDNIFN